MTKRTLLTLAAFLAFAAPAHAASVAYIDGHNLWLASPDGSRKIQLTQDGTADHPYNFPSQGPDGKTVVAHKAVLNDQGERRQVLYLYGADGKLQTANVMPVYSGATAPVYPLALDMDWSSNAVAYGYQYCGWACQTTYKGYWLTFSDQQSLYPTNPQGASDSFFPTFYGKRVVSSDSGGRIFVQPDVSEAPFTSSYQMWLDVPNFRLSRAEVSKVGDFVALDWTQMDPNTYQPIASGVSIGRHEGSVPSNVNQICDLQTAANPMSLTFSYDGTQMAWKDDEGVKVAGVPNLAAGTPTCSLTAPAVVIAPNGRAPHFGGADVAAILGSQQPAEQAPQAPASPSQPAPPGTAPTPSAGGVTLTVKSPGKVTGNAFAKGIVLQVTAAAPGRIAASASVPAKQARKAGLVGRSGRASLAAAVAKAVVVARGAANATGSGPVKLKLKPTPAAKRAAKKLRKAVVTITVSQGTTQTRVALRLS